MSSPSNNSQGPFRKLTQYLYSAYTIVAGWGFFFKVLHALGQAGLSAWSQLGTVSIAAVALLIWGSLLEPSGLATSVGFLCSILSGILFLAAVGHLIAEALRLHHAAEGKLGFSPSKILKACRKLIVAIYDRRSFSHLHTVQFGLRMMLVLFVSSNAAWSLAKRTESPALHGLQFVITVNAIHVAASVVYFIVIATGFRSKRRDLLRLEECLSHQTESETRTLVAASFWSGARLDLVYVSLIWITTVLPGRPFHLAYIIPMMGTWLFDGERALRTFYLVIVGLVGRCTSLALTAQLSDSTAAALGYPGYMGTFLLLWGLLPELAFWLTLGVLLAILRHLRWKAKEKARILREALAKESLLRRAFETLSANQGDAVFAKDVSRRFIFANDVLLARFRKLEEQRGRPCPDLKAAWALMEGRTDGELSIDRGEYEKSDLKVLRSKGGDDDHYADFEPPFEPGADPGTMIWTRKEAIRDSTGVVIGLVGCIVDGLPIQMQRMCNYLVSRLPIYASMKDAEGYIVWTNERHLQRLAPAIERLISDQKIVLTAGADLRQKFKAINNGRGPKDDDLYGSRVGGKYRMRDMEILECARRCGSDSSKFEEEMNRMIRSWFANSKRGNYPEEGWMEYHRFPDDDHPAWVQVWKMPWWNESTLHRPEGPDLKGLLVFFQDHHKSYMKESVAWRWLKGHMFRAEESCKDLIDSALRNAQLQPAQSAQLLGWLQLPALLRRLLIWFESTIAEQENPSQTPTEPRDMEDLRALLVVLAESWRDQVRIEAVLPETNLRFEQCGDWLFGAITCLLINAIEATIRSQADSRSLTPVKLHIQKDSLNTLVVRIQDAACQNTSCTIQEADTQRMYELGALNSKDGAPGGGLFIARALTRRIVESLSPPVTNTAAVPLLLSPASRGEGVVATIRIPMEAFLLSQPRV